MDFCFISGIMMFVAEPEEAVCYCFDWVYAVNAYVQWTGTAVFHTGNTCTGMERWFLQKTDRSKEMMGWYEF